MKDMIVTYMYEDTRVMDSSHRPPKIVEAVKRFWSSFKPHFPPLLNRSCPNYSLISSESGLLSSLESVEQRIQGTDRLAKSPSYSIRQLNRK